MDLRLRNLQIVTTKRRGGWYVGCSMLYLASVVACGSDAGSTNQVHAVQADEADEAVVDSAEARAPQQATRVRSSSQTSDHSDAGQAPASECEDCLCSNDRGSCVQEGQSVRCTCTDGNQRLARLEPCDNTTCLDRLEHICPQPEAECDLGRSGGGSRTTARCVLRDDGTLANYDCECETLEADASTPEITTVTIENQSCYEAMVDACFPELAPESPDFECTFTGEVDGETVIAGCAWNETRQSYRCSCEYGAGHGGSRYTEGSCEEALQAACFPTLPEDDCTIELTSPQGTPMFGGCRALEEQPGRFDCTCEWEECRTAGVADHDIVATSCDEAVRHFCSPETQRVD